MAANRRKAEKKWKFARIAPSLVSNPRIPEKDFGCPKIVKRRKFPVRKDAMKNPKLRVLLSLVSLFSFLIATNSAFAAPVRFEQVQQVLNVEPGRANTGGFAQLRFADDNVLNVNGDDDDKTVTQPQQDDDRVIVTTTTTVEEEDCDCPLPPEKHFPKWAFLGLAVIPLIFIFRDDDKKHHKTPPPHMSPPPSESPTPTKTPTTTPTTTPKVTPTPEPVPEPMTILLFGTGLAGIGLAARRRLRKRDGTSDADGNEQNES
jgi:PEP-CTERM motif